MHRLHDLGSGTAQEVPMVGVEQHAVARTLPVGKEACSVEVIESADAVMQAEADWRMLSAAGGVATPFQSFVVASAAAAAHVRRGEMPRLVIARRGGRPVVIVPTVSTSWLGTRVLRFLGDPLTQYGDVLAAPDVRADDISAAWAAAVRACSASVALMRRVREDAHIARHLAAIATEVSVQESPLVEFSRPSALTPRDARELRRLRRRLGELGNVQMEVLFGPEAEDLLLHAVELKRGWIKTHALGSTVIGDADWEKALREICRAGGLTIAVLRVGGNSAAFEVALRDASCWYGFIGVFVEDFGRMGPGQVLTAACIEYAREAGLTCYDQLPPAHAYKRQQATRTLAVRDYALPLTAAGRLAMATAGMVPAMKSIFCKLPTDLRRPLLSLLNR